MVEWMEEIYHLDLPSIPALRLELLEDFHRQSQTIKSNSESVAHCIHSYA